MNKPEAINKIKLLLKLAESSNQNEADSARLQAEKLKQKFDVQDQDLSDGPDIFEERFFFVVDIPGIEELIIETHHF